MQWLDAPPAAQPYPSAPGFQPNAIHAQNITSTSAYVCHKNFKIAHEKRGLRLVQCVFTCHSSSSALNVFQRRRLIPAERRKPEASKQERRTSYCQGLDDYARGSVMPCGIANCNVQFAIELPDLRHSATARNRPARHYVLLLQPDPADNVQQRSCHETKSVSAMRPATCQTLRVATAKNVAGYADAPLPNADQNRHRTELQRHTLTNRRSVNNVP